MFLKMLDNLGLQYQKCLLIMNRQKNNWQVYGWWTNTYKKQVYGVWLNRDKKWQKLMGDGLKTKLLTNYRWWMDRDAHLTQAAVRTLMAYEQSKAANIITQMLYINTRLTKILF